MITEDEIRKMVDREIKAINVVEIDKDLYDRLERYCYNKCDRKAS